MLLEIVEEYCNLLLIHSRLINSDHMYLTVFWILFCIQHSVFASVWWKRMIQKILGKSFRFYRFFYSVFATVSLVFLIYFQYNIRSSLLWTGSVFLNLIAYSSAASGILIMLVCMRKYFNFVSGINAFSSQNSAVSILKTGGMHSYTRHPLYFGTLLFIWSLFLLFPLWSNLLVCVLITAYTIIGIRIEERKLIIEFGEKYTDYSSQVPMLIPRLFSRRKNVRHQFPETVYSNIAD